MLIVVVLGGLALAGRGKKKDVAEEPPPPEPIPVVEEVPPPPPPPGLWDKGLPVALQQIPEGLASLSAQSCNSCHYAAHDQWKDGAHAHAWRDPVYQEALARVGDATLCASCHLPLANQQPRLAASYRDGEVDRPELQLNEAWDAGLMSEGVTCAACHVREGKVLGPHAVEGGPHEVVQTDELTDSAMCAACHQLTWPDADQPFYNTFGEWKATPYAEAGVRCQDCHMPPVAGAAVATHFAAQPSHELEAQHARALTVLVDLGAPELQRGEPLPVTVRLLNTGAGHHVPTGSPFKRYTVEIGLLDADGVPMAESTLHSFGRTLEETPPWRTLSDDRIPAGGELSIETTIDVSQRKRAQEGVLQVRLHRVEGDPSPVLLREIPLPVY